MQVTTSVLRSGFISLSLITSVAALCGCGEDPSAKRPPPATAAPNAQPAAVSPAAAEPRELPPSDAEAQEFAGSFEKTLASGDTAAIDAAIDVDALLRRALSGIDLGEDVRQDYVNDAKAEITGPKGIAWVMFAKTIARGGRCRLLHVHRQGDEQRALCRMTTAEGWIDYFDFILLRAADGKVRVGDFYVYSEGELESDDLHRKGLCIAVESRRELLEKFSPMDRDYVTHVGEVREMRNSVAAKRFQEAVNIYQGMPELLKNHRHVLQQRFLACCHLEGQFDEALRAYRAASPHDPGIDLYLLNYYLLHRQFDDLLACIDRLDRAVGGDPHLDLSRAFVHHQKGNLAAAKKCAQNAAAAEPESRMARDYLKMISLLEKNAPADRSADPKSGTSPGEPAGDTEAQAFANAFERTVMSSDMAAVDDAAVNRRALAQLNLPEATRIGVEVGLASSAGVRMAGLFAVSRPQVEQGAHFRLLHLRRESGEQRVIFRRVSAKLGIDYLDCILVRHADGKVRIDDVYSFERGETLSETLCQLLSLANLNRGKESEAAVVGPANDGAKFALAWPEMTKRIKAGEYQEALDIYDGLPDRLKKEKVFLITRIAAANGLKGKSYDEAVIGYRKEFPNDRNMDLVMIDAYYSHKLFDRVIASIDGLDRTIGGDPYLDAMRGQAYFGKGDLAAAKRCSEKSIEGEPDVPTAYLCLLTISLREKDFAKTSALLTMVREKFPRRMPALENNPAYVEYTRSPQYRAWVNAKKP